MKNKHQENGARTGPLIFTLPVFCLDLDWLDGTGWAAVFVETRDLGAGSAPICTAAPRRTRARNMSSGVSALIAAVPWSRSPNVKRGI